MTAETTTAPSAWKAAVSRATVVADRELPGRMKEDCWDDVAVRDIITVVLYALHVRHATPVDEMPWSKALWWLWDDERVIHLVEDTLPAAGRALTTPDDELTDPLLSRWRWLNRTWDPDAPIRRRNVPPPPWEILTQRGHDAADGPLPEPRWEGMSRGIAGALPDPAVEVCTPWAAAAVGAVLSAEQGYLTVLQRARVHGGRFAGQGGYVRDIRWHFDDEKQQVTGPESYAVDLDDTEGTERIDAELLQPATDFRWAHRPEGTLKDGPPPELSTPLPPIPSCAEDLERLLAGASNPEALPEDLRNSIRGARRHHHLDMRRLAAPRPHRATAQLLLHWYELTDRYMDDPAGRAEVWELLTTEHLHDEQPVRRLATSESEAKALAKQHTGLLL
ncbi:hypothetical protein [Streptomyces acidiscabies]|uniref:Uncharacterized protein n=1 Tax=Streptomyces acidiscabies TaxID=42234 RepID=A0ABU4ME76_9ACTN|nr:hypothetical protein [Streptomyces acidiscabies]MDX3024998.1 hypothetical protein [Streptomyces acidiscabies]